MRHYILDYLAFKFEAFFVLDYLLNYKHTNRIEQLRKEPWFEELFQDLRYSYIIVNNKDVRKYLSKNRAIDYLRSSEQARKEFTDLVKNEHIKFSGIY